MDFNLLDKLSIEYGESFYLLDSNVFSSNYDQFLFEFRRIYQNTHIGYSYKTNYIPRLCQILNDKGGYAEVVSEMEYDLALKVGVDYDKIIVNGPYKTKNTLKKFLFNGSIVNLDSIREIEFVLEIAEESRSRDFAVGIRTNFDIRDDNFSRFGIDVNSPLFDTWISKLKQASNIKVEGIHCHFPNRDLESYVYRAEEILNLVDIVFDEHPKYIDIGGGFFGKMHQDLKDQFSCSVPEFREYAEVIATRFEKKYRSLSDESKPILFLEPGSALVANSMKFVAKIIEIKEVRGRNIAMSTGSKFNIGLLSSKVNMPMTVYGANDNESKDFELIDISGFTCIESDYLYKGYSGKLNRDDYIVFDNVGSYSVVFKPPFILPNVPIIEVNKDNTLIKRKETTEDIFKTFIF